MPTKKNQTPEKPNKEQSKELVKSKNDINLKGNEIELSEIDNLNNKNPLNIIMTPEPKQVNKYKVGRTEFDYIPIDFMESELDAIFGADGWQTVNQELKPLGQIDVDRKGNPLFGAYCQIELKVKSPITNEWITRVGSASTFVSQGTLKTLGSSISALAFKNACKSLGIRFGRQINRQDDKIDYEQLRNIFEVNFADEIQAAETIEELQQIQIKYPLRISKSKEFRNILNKRAIEIKNNEDTKKIKDNNKKDKKD